MAASEKQTEEQFRALGARALERLVDDYQKQPSRYSGEIAKDLRQLVELRSEMNAKATIGWLAAAVALTPLAIPLAPLFVAFNKQLRQTDPQGSTTKSLGHVTKKRGEQQQAGDGLRQAIERLQNLPSNFDEAFEAVRDMRSAFHKDIAAIIGPRLNEHLKSMPQDSYPEKQELAAWVNAQMRQLGLAIKCPRNRIPGRWRRPARWGTGGDSGDAWLPSNGRPTRRRTAGRRPSRRRR